MNNIEVKEIYLNCNLNYEGIATWIKKNHFIFPNTNNDSLRTIYRGLQELPWPIIVITSEKKIRLFTGLIGWYQGFHVREQKYVVDEKGWLCENTVCRKSVPGKRFCKLDEVTIKNKKICIPLSKGETEQTKSNSKT
jgi:hypothetical protein